MEKSVFCGREAELAKLRREWAWVVEHRQPRVVVLLADNGLGKTRLVQEFYGWLSTHGDGPGDTGYWPDELELRGDNLEVNPPLAGCRLDRDWPFLGGPVPSGGSAPQRRGRRHGRLPAGPVRKSRDADRRYQNPGPQAPRPAMPVRQDPLARLSAFQAARQKVSTNRFSKRAGISTRSVRCRDPQKSCGVQSILRTAARASLNVG